MIKLLKRIFSKKEKLTKEGWDKFAKRFEGPGLTETELNAAYAKYADSHTIWPKNMSGKTLAESLPSVIPMKHSFESFSFECNEDYKFYKKYKS